MLMILVLNFSIIDHIKKSRFTLLNVHKWTRLTWTGSRTFWLEVEIGQERIYGNWIQIFEALW